MNTQALRRPSGGGKTAPADLGDLEAAWRAYCRTSQKAQASHAIADGVAAGQAWHRWLRLFERSP